MDRKYFQMYSAASIQGSHIRAVNQGEKIHIIPSTQAEINIRWDCHNSPTGPEREEHTDHTSLVFEPQSQAVTHEPPGTYAVVKPSFTKRTCINVFTHRLTSCWRLLVVMHHPAPYSNPNYHHLNLNLIPTLTFKPCLHLQTVLLNLWGTATHTHTLPFLVLFYVCMRKLEVCVKPACIPFDVASSSVCWWKYYPVGAHFKPTVNIFFFCGINKNSFAATPTKKNTDKESLKKNS